MKKLKCQYCMGVWMVEDGNLEKQVACPYCQLSIQEEIKFVEFDSLAKVIWGAISKHGIGVLQDSQKFTDYMLTNAPALKKEIRILTRTLTEDYIDHIVKLFTKTGMDSIEPAIEKLWHQLIEEEGLSEGWADIICAGLLGAIQYSRKIGNTRLINVSVDDLPDVRQWKLYLQSDSTDKRNASSKTEVPEEDSNSPKQASHNLNTTNEDPVRIMQQVSDFYNRGTASLFIKNEQEAIKRLKTIANTYQHVPAYMLLGKIYMKGNRMALAKDWYTKAAEAGNLEAICIMCHFNEDYIYFLEHYAKDATAEQLATITTIAQAFFAGKELPQNDRTALAILEVAAKFGCADAQYQLAQHYQDGIGIPQNPRKAIELYRDAAINGHAAAQYKLQALTPQLTFIQRFKLKLL